MSTSLNCQFRSVPISSQAFWISANILLKKPHVINKRLWGCKFVFETAYESNSESHCPARLKDTQDIDYFIEELSMKYGSSHPKNIMKDSEYPMKVILLELLPKAYLDPHAFQLVFINIYETSVTFCDITPEGIKQNLVPDFTYTFKLYDYNIILDLNNISDATTTSGVWLQNLVLSHMVKWAMETSQANPNQLCNESLALVSHDKYYQKYNELKDKYGREMVKIWPECTDPSKFVYEDVAIASYILLIWEEERSLCNLTSPQSFVDLGCGNGLLVYILIKEGHPGVGIDIRKRQIWDLYSYDIKLEERTIIPSDTNLFPEVDWIIGNHSDELTPWIPVISARSSYKCNFFLLPCCAYNFDGTKYQRQNSSKSQYTEYLEYIRKLCEECGFHTDTDRLKIPSTKRICLIGRGRTYCENKHISIIEKIRNITGIENEVKNTWIKDFKPREPVEKVKNCTQLDKPLINGIVDIISKYLLKDCSLHSAWSAGKLVELNELVKILPEEKLRGLKSECGGLQTLLKNHHHIFKVQKGKVQFRYPKTVEEVNCGKSKNLKKYKTAHLKLQHRPCWFFNNHPQGCPLQDSSCSFLHSKS